MSLSKPWGGDAPVQAESPWGAPPPATGSWAPVPTQRADVVPSWALASPWVRLGASLLNGLLAVVTLFIGYLIWTVILWDKGTNPGKKILGLVVVKADTGRRCTWGEMFVRSVVFGYVVMGLIGTVTLGIGYLVDALMIFGDRHQRLTDRMAGTLVVVAPE